MNLFPINNKLSLRLDKINTSQHDDSVSRERHIGIYRQNLIIVKEIKEDIASLEKIVVTAGGPPAPELLSGTKIKANAPSRTMTWMIIFIIIIFVMTIVIFCEAFKFPGFVFVNPSFQVVCKTCVNHIFMFIGHDINEEVVLA